MRLERSFVSLIFSIVFAGVVLCADVSGQITEPSAKSAPANISFLVIYSPGPNWIKGKSVKEQPLKDHGKYMIDLYGKGIMKFAGPFSDDSGGAAVLEVKSAEEAAAVVKADPAVKSGIMTPKLVLWELVTWEKYIKK